LAVTAPITQNTFWTDEMTSFFEQDVRYLVEALCESDFYISGQILENTKICSFNLEKFNLLR